MVLTWPGAFRHRNRGDLREQQYSGNREWKRKRSLETDGSCMEPKWHWGKSSKPTNVWAFLRRTGVRSSRSTARIQMQHYEFPKRRQLEQAEHVPTTFTSSCECPFDSDIHVLGGVNEMKTGSKKGRPFSWTQPRTNPALSGAKLNRRSPMSPFCSKCPFWSQM